MKANNFQDARAFLAKEGQQGPQRMILHEGTYAINIAQFVVITEDQLYCLPSVRSELETVQKPRCTPVRNSCAMR